MLAGIQSCNAQEIRSVERGVCPIAKLYLRSPIGSQFEPTVRLARSLY